MRADGAIIIDGQTVADTMMCVHCGGHFIIQRGSGRRRGFCLKCGGVTCGQPSCNTCIPVEKWLAESERGR